MSDWAGVMRQAVNNNGYFYFDASIAGVSGTKRYYVYLGS